MRIYWDLDASGYVKKEMTEELTQKERELQKQENMASKKSRKNCFRRKKGFWFKMSD